MNTRFHKIALSATAAVFTVTTAVSTVYAAQKNRIVLSADKAEVKSGESFNITLAYDPDSLGVSGFTIDLHYDPNAVTLNVPDENDTTAAGNFSLITNYSYSSGTVRFVGAQLNSENVTEYTEIGTLEFTVNDGFSGEIPFWNEVDTLVASQDNSFVNVDFQSRSPYDPFTVSAPAVTKPKQTTTTAAETTAATTTTTTTTTAAEQTQTLPQEVLPAETEPVQTAAETETAEPQTGAEPLFTHKQGKNDYNNETALQYIFSPYEHFDGNGGLVDISVDISSTGSAKGGIGMQTSEGWKIYSNTAYGEGEEIWTAENVDLSDVSGDMAVQLYYLKNKSTFSINSITVTPAGQQAAEPVQTTVTTSAPQTSAATAAAPETTTTTATTTTTTTTTTEAQTEAPESTASVKLTGKFNGDAVGNASDGEKPVTTLQAAEAAPAETTQMPAQTTSPAPSVPDSGDPQVQQIQQAVDNASSAANANPDTGIPAAPTICYSVLILCAAQMVYSLYSIVKKKNN